MNNKQIILTAWVFLLFSNKASSQFFEQGNSYVGVGYGLVSFEKMLTISIPHSETSYEYKGVGPLFVKYEYAITDRIGLGVNVAYSDNEVNSKSNGYKTSIGTIIDLEERITYSSLSVLARFNYHFGKSNRIDPYIGLGLGYRSFSYTFEENDPYSRDLEIGHTLGNIGLDLTFGTRFMFTDNIGIFGEFGAAKSLFQFGLIGRF